MADVDGGAGHAIRRRPIPHGNLVSVGGEVLGMDQRVAHGHTGAVVVQDRIVHRIARRCRPDRRSLIEAPIESGNPLRTGIGDRCPDEFLTRKWQDHVEIGPPFEKRLGRQDVGTSGQRSESEPHRQPLENRLEFTGDR